MKSSAYSFPLTRSAIFAVFYGLLLLLGFRIAHSVVFAEHRVLLGNIITFDLVFLPIALLYFILLKGININKLMLVGIALILLRIAFSILPAGTEPFHISGAVLLAIGELSVLVTSVIRFRTLLKEYRVLRPLNTRDAAILGSLEKVFGLKLATLLQYEGYVLRYSLLGWWRTTTDLLPHQQPITSHRESGQVALSIAVLAVILIEGIGVHLLLARWNPTVAFWTTALSVYGTLFLVADLVTTCSRPSFLTPDTFFLRLGLRWKATISYENIDSVLAISEKPAKEHGLVNGAFLTAPNTLIILREPIWVQGAYGIRKKTHRISMFADNKEVLFKALQPL